MGGGDDAVSVVAPSVTAITNVSIDHVRWLGRTREQIGARKAGILRPGIPVVYGEQFPPATVTDHAAQVGAPWFGLKRDFGHERSAAGWDWWGGALRVEGLPRPPRWSDGQQANADAAMMALSLLPAPVRPRLADVAPAVAEAGLPGRQQFLPGPVERVLDVAHNLAATRSLRDVLRAWPAAGRTFAVFAMLGDKDVEAVVGCMRGLVDRWFVGGIDASRGISAATLASRMSAIIAGGEISTHDDVGSAYRAALAEASSGDRVVVWGSFHTVASALRVERAHRPGED